MNSVKFKKFIGEAISELKKISWPNRRGTIKMVYTIIGLSFLTAAFLGIWDKIFLEMVRFVTKLKL
jgi:preprotein translocase SecE subunit